VLEARLGPRGGQRARELFRKALEVDPTHTSAVSSFLVTPSASLWGLVRFTVRLLHTGRGCEKTPGVSCQ
jgi:hypothetical protein